MATRGGDTRAKAQANGKKVGRPQKPRIEQKANKSIATEVLAMDGPPDHVRKCSCRICEKHPKNCTCVVQCGDCGKLEKNCECEEYRAITIKCAICHTVADHRICQCELCRWWAHRLSSDKRIRYDADVYLTNQRDGKPAEKIEGSFDPDKPFVLTIEHIGRNPRKAAAPAAQTK
jgi:hypothetical protein